MACKHCRKTASSTLTKEEFYEIHNIDPDEIGYLGKGDNGEAWYVGDNRVLKITRSKEEWDLAKKLIGRSSEFENFVEYYAAEQVGSSYYILMEQVDTDSDIEDLFNSASEYLPDGPAHADTFDVRDYAVNGQGEDEDTPYIAKDVADFIEELSNVSYDYKKLGIFAPDIKADNLGRDVHGTLKAFDIFSRK